MKLQNEDKNVKLKKCIKKSNNVYTYNKYKSGELILISIVNRFTGFIGNNHNYSNVIRIQQLDTKLRPIEN